MMMRFFLTTVVTLALAWTGRGADRDQAAGLKVGDAAPALKTGKFVQGEPLKSFQTGKVYVVAFWSTWSGPCRMTIPRLNELWEQHKGKGLVVLGQSVWEREDEKVAPFVSKMGDRMSYAVALDDKSKDEQGAMAQAWLDASGEGEIPVVFVVDKAGRIAWIGHPMDDLDRIVEGVLAGSFDAKKFAEQRAKQIAETPEAHDAAPEATLHVGDPAPKLRTGKWVQGRAIEKFEPGKIYVVEFWATWCAPCRQSIPHLNELWNTYKDKGVVVIGQNALEEDDDLVAKFVQKRGEKMGYPVALDDKSKDERGAMFTTWLEAAGQDGIPCAFVVGKDGRIAWIGHPLDQLDRVVEGLVKGTFDPKKEADRRAAAEKQMEKLTELSADLGEAMQGADWEKALKIADEMENAAPPEAAAQMVDVKFRILAEKKDADTAIKLARVLGEKYHHDAETLNVIAWELLTQKNFEAKRDVALAEKLATRASDLSKDENPAILDTLARALFMKGEKAKAIKLQRKAVSLSEDEEKELLKDTLDSYERGELPPADEEGGDGL